VLHSTIQSLKEKLDEASSSLNTEKQRTKDLKAEFEEAREEFTKRTGGLSDEERQERTKNALELIKSSLSTRYRESGSMEEAEVQARSESESHNAAAAIDVAERFADQAQALFESIGEERAIDKFYEAKRKLAILSEQMEQMKVTLSGEERQKAERYTDFRRTMDETFTGVSAALSRSFEEIGCRG